MADDHIHFLLRILRDNAKGGRLKVADVKRRLIESGLSSAEADHVVAKCDEGSLIKVTDRRTVFATGRSAYVGEPWPEAAITARGVIWLDGIEKPKGGTVIQFSNNAGGDITIGQINVNSHVTNVDIESARNAFNNIVDSFDAPQELKEQAKGEFISTLERLGKTTAGVLGAIAAGLGVIGHIATTVGS